MFACCAVTHNWTLQVTWCFYNLWKKFCKSCGWPQNHLLISGHCMLNFCGGRSTTSQRQRERVRLRQGEREGGGRHVAPEGLGPVCHCATTIRPVTDPWTQSLQVNSDSLPGSLFVSYVAVGASAFCLPWCRWLSLFISWCRRQSVCVCVQEVCLRSSSVNEMRCR